MGKACSVFLVFCFAYLSSVSAQDLIVTYAGDSMNVKIGRIFSDKILYSIGNSKGVINSREVSSFQRNYYDEVAKSNLSNKNNNKEVMHIGFNYSWAYRLGTIPDQLNDFMQDFQKRLKSGRAYGVELGFFVNQNIALGFSFNRYESQLRESNVLYSIVDYDTNIFGPYGENITISFYAPSIYYKVSNYAETVNFLFHASIGVCTYENSVETVILNNRNRPENGQHSLKGSTLSMALGISADVKVNDHIYLGPRISLFTGAITDFSYKDKYRKDVITLPDKGESVTSLSLGGSLKFYF